MAKWKRTKDPLYRGDVVGGVALPDPSADPSLVRHILYLDGYGRQTPYLSTTEARATAERFARPAASRCVYATSVPDWDRADVQHISRKELLQLLRPPGKGEAKWPSAFEIMQARRRVEEHAEHLASFRAHDRSSEDGLRGLCDSLFKTD